MHVELLGRVSQFTYFFISPSILYLFTGQVNILKDYDRYYMTYIQNTLSRHDANSPASFRAQVELANRAEVIAEQTDR